MVSNHRGLLSLGLRDPVIQAPAHIGGKALLAALEDHHTDHPSLFELTLTDIVEDLLGLVQDKGDDLGVLIPDLQTVLGVEGEVVF